MLGSLSTKEYQELIAEKKKKKTNQKMEGDDVRGGDESLDEGEFHWDTELGEVG